MSLLRNFSPGGSEPDDDDEQPTTDEQAATAERAGNTVPPGGGHAPGNPRYAFAAPASAAPLPGAVVASEVIPEPELEPEPEPAPAGRPEEVVPAPVAEAPAPPPAPETTPSPAMEAPAPETVPVPVPAPETAPVPVPSPRGAGEGEGEPAARPAGVTGPDFGAPLLRDAAELRARWQRVQGDFVDDPQAAVTDAADLVGQTAEALVDALRERQRQLRAVWERGAANGESGQPGAAMAPGVPDTEHLRLMIQRYRALFNQLCRPS